MVARGPSELTKEQLLDLWHAKARCAWSTRTSWKLWQAIEPRLTAQERTMLTVSCSHLETEGPEELDYEVECLKEKWLLEREALSKM